jgi:hypothetical protein
MLRARIRRHTLYLLLPGRIRLHSADTSDGPIPRHAGRIVTDARLVARLALLAAVWLGALLFAEAARL